MDVTRREMLTMMAATAAASGLPGEQSEASAETPAIPSTASTRDWRDIVTGSEIPRESYSDQPYVVITKDGNWLCVLTTGSENEGTQGQHIISTISSDKGATWSAPVDIEPASGPEASWVMPLAVPSGRVYVFYTYNYENLRFDTKANDPGYSARRVDTQGKYALKYSDDYGRTWSAERLYIPMREMRIDRENPYGGKLRYFWGVGKPIITPHGVIFGFSKVGKWGTPGLIVTSQSCFMQSPNILSENDPKAIQWNLLPDGDEGLRAPKGPVAEEVNPVELNDGSLYALYRTIDGYSCHAYSHDRGHTWTPAAYATYTPNGRNIKHPRAATFVKKFSNRHYLMWYHNHAGESMLTGPWNPYLNRNPAWVAGGIEREGHIYWSQPEILLYDADPKTSMSYPDFVEDGGEFYVTETIKTHARVHHIERSLLEGMWNQADARSVSQRGLLQTVTVDQLQNGSTIAMPKLPSLQGSGFTIEFWIRLSELTEEQIILDARDGGTRGIAIATSDHSTLAIALNDGVHQAAWDSDPGIQEGTLRTGAWQHIAFVVDGGPKIITVIVDGILNDGGPLRDYGWGRFHSELDDVNGLASAKVGVGIFGAIRLLRIYDRPLRTSEVVGNWRAGMS